jgi:hypothetical protein
MLNFMAMEKDELLKDDILSRLLKNTVTESPSDEFIEKVMTGVRSVPAIETTPRFFSMYLKTALPYIGLVAAVLFFVFTSDMPFDKYLSHTDYFSKYFLPYFTSMVGGFKVLFASRFVTFAMGVALSAGFLMLVEHFFSRRSSMHHPLV